MVFWGMGILHSLEVTLVQRSRICKRLKEEEEEEGLWNLVLFMPKNAWPQLTNHNHSECQFRSFSSLTKAPDLEPMKQKKADVMGLRKSPRGVKPHPHPPTQLPPTHPPSVSENPTPIHPSTLLLKWSPPKYGHFELPSAPLPPEVQQVRKL